ncbi:G-protein-signaling modulator 2 isoform X2 [Salmo salar]|uniref:G-protein-signaling modulator 2 isoform X2 n=1 Tax=Salmo salar TaxID=8030 RepID=A0A1S3P9R6_SALSA|nr:G-protein-signaling modulator 2 isoform X2 [Salmo salar]|eukprot:XP_014024341.1 PREDICTED: G-protein-signaling modulator 2-like isoform X2 [Salmo salar]
MCMHAKGQQLSCLSLKEPVSIIASDGVIKKLEMSFLSRVREWVRMKRGSRMEMSCLELALKGERQCKVGDYRAAVSFFESAIQVGTEDLQILSAIYSQLGNAYFHLQEYSKALEYHCHDLTLTRTIGDELGEAKASGNLGNTLKVLGRFDEAVVCCQRHYDITRGMYDKGKSICWTGGEPGEIPEEAKFALNKATEYYELNLSIVMDLEDRAAQGRTYGNLGNAYYLLGNFQKTVGAHEQRLLIAKEFGDRAAERRAYCNLGNAYIFLGQFGVAAEHYKRTLQLARLLKDKAVEAQACYSLGNTYTLLHDYERAIDYHLKHLIIARELKDRVGEGRACWSLGNAHTALGNHQDAIHFTEKHLEISKETGDKNSEATARMTLSDLKLLLVMGQNPSSSLNTNSSSNFNSNSSVLTENLRKQNTLPGVKSEGRRNSMENLEVVELSPEKTVENWDEGVFRPPNPKSSMAKASSKLFFINRLRGKKHKKHSSPTRDGVLQDTSNKPTAPEMDTQKSEAKIGGSDTLGDEGFFDLLSRFQGSRMEDQRCSLLDDQSSLTDPFSLCTTPPVVMRKLTTSACEANLEPGHFLDLLATSQGRRLDEQRASVGSSFPGLRLCTSNHSLSPPISPLMTSADKPQADDVFFDMLVKCQGSRLNDQRCTEPPLPTRGSTVPDEDFLSLILRSQANRMDEQRVPLPPSSDAVPSQPCPD